MSKTVLLIHGAWLTPSCWNLFRSRFEEKGYTTVAPAWPHFEQPTEELRRGPNPEIATLTVKKIVDYYAKLIQAMPEAPIIMGHSYGGLFTQMLLDRGLGAAGVAIDAVPMRGVLPTPRALWSALPVFLKWNGWNRVLTMSFEQFASNFGQTLPKAEIRAAYDRYIVPAPGRLYYQAAFGIGTGVNAENPLRAPLLLIAGEKDRTIETSMVQGAYIKQSRAPSATGFKSFPGRSHFLFAEPGWEEVADYALQWASQHVRPTPKPDEKPFHSAAA